MGTSFSRATSFMRCASKSCPFTVTIGYLKTPEGLKTNVSGADGDFKIVRLKKGSAAVTEENGKNLNDKYEINKAGGYAIYHIYKKDKYAGVVFDKNGGDEEGWINHEIAYKGETIKASNGKIGRAHV